MSANRKVRQVIEGDTFDTPVVKKEATWLDQIDLDPEARGKPQQGAGVLWYIRLEQGEAQTTSKPARQDWPTASYRYRQYSLGRLILRQSVTSFALSNSIASGSGPRRMSWRLV
jgi:hypothetical protein